MTEEQGEQFMAMFHLAGTVGEAVSALRRTDPELAQRLDDCWREFHKLTFMGNK